MIYVIDKAVTGDIHVVFNSSLLKILMLVYPGEQIEFCSEEVHGRLVKDMLKDDTGLVIFKRIRIANSHSSGFRKIFQWFTKTAIDLLFFVKLFKHMEKGEGSLAILNIPPISFLFFKFIKFFYPKRIIYLLLHGELEYLYYNHNYREKVIGFFYKFMFALKGYNMRYIVFNKIAKNFLVNDKYARNNQIIEIEHPYIFSDNVVTKSLLKDNPLLIANIGSLMVRKRGDKIFELADLLKSDILKKKLSVCTIGKVDAELMPFSNGLVEGVENTVSSLSRKIFEQHVENIHYSLFFFDETNFIFRASGALMDALNFEKPVIALKHTLFSSLFRQYGTIGYLCDDINEMAALIKNINSNRTKFEEEYLIQVDNIKKIKEKCSIVSIAFDFKTQDQSFNISPV